MKGNKKRFFTILLLCLIAPLTIAQSSKTLKNKRSKTLKKIEFTKKVLRETKKQKEASLHTLHAVQSLISTREQYISEISTELVQLDTEITQNKTALEAEKKRLELEKQRLAKLVYTIYKTKNSYQRIAYVLSASNFNDAMRRLDYMNQIARKQSQFVSNIDRRKAQIERTLTVLNNYRIEKDSTLVLQKSEQENLLKDKEEKQAVVKTLQGKEQELKKTLKEQRRIAANLNRAIKRAIAREIEIARKKREAERKRREAERKRKEAERKKNNKPPTKEPDALASTPEIEQLENNFLANKGKLPWPVTKGFISERFGRREHESLAGIVIENNGVDITTSSSAQARVIFDGEVSAIMDIPGMGTTVLVSHGNYFSVYAKLSSVSVSQGQELTAKQSIGTVMTESGKTIIHLEIWHGQAKQNPALWLMRR